ncbi:MAG: Do family serine endopeptidase [Pseudomonadales bacterium]|nr:Do family serine endopeptidase [Pseudomonadales bacterium]NIX07160.1 Do family serine endopeptidase [Pseudomonadales bacterium]
MAATAALPLELPGGEQLPSLAPMLDRATPAVVNIATYTTVQVRNPLLEDPFFRRFFNVPDQRRFRRTQSAGSGVVVDADSGYIVTNNHVVERADEVTVTLADGRSITAELVGSDPQVDLAVLKVDADDLQQIGFADSGDLRVGDFVVAIGNPFGLRQTVTSGIISALGRSGLGIEGYEDFIQTDASINPGNSGGALVDLAGRLVGINTAILAPSGGNVGIGFAIPSNMVQAIMEQLIEHGEVRRGYLGLAVQGLNVDLAEAFGVDRREGVVVVEVEPDSSAESGGLQAGDIITRVGDRDIGKIADFHSQAAVTFVGDQVQIEVVRDGEPRQVTLKIGEDKLEKVRGRRIDRRLAGTQLQNFRNQDEPSMGAGVLVLDVDPDSDAYRFGLRPGDILVAANRRAIVNLAELREVARRDDGQLLLRVYRSGQFGYVAIR